MVRLFLAGSLALFALVGHAELPIEEFFQRPVYSQLKLSPDGSLIAAIVRGAKRDTLAVLQIDTRRGRPITNFADADVLSFRWVDNRRLVFYVGDAHEAAGNAEFYGTYLVNVDGSDLAPVTRSDLRAAREDAPLARALLGCPGVEALRAVTWCIRDSHGVVRVARSAEDGRERVSYRRGPDAGWEILEDAEEGKLSFWPLDMDANDVLYVRAYEPGSDKLAIFRYNVDKRRIGERVARHLDANMDNVVIDESGHLLGYSYSGQHASVIWVDEHVARVQRMVDRALPDTSNAVSLASENPKRALISAHSDIAPPTFYLFDTEKLRLEKFASSRPWIKPAEMSKRNLVVYKARDGLPIPAYLTLPKGSAGKNLPLVVEIHGGPWIAKQTDDFNPHAQFLASRGYAVLQPDFRGTLDYGKRHYEASFGQWGFAMQDDITDGVEWLIRQGIADKNRVCLIGASYGGYATLWGLMKTPDLYRCGVAYVAVTDIGAMFGFNRWDRGRSLWMDRDEAHRRIGDPSRDEEKFKSVSPVAQAARLKAPVLLAYGGVDQRVPLKQGNALRSALDRYGKTYEWVLYDDEGHGFNDDKNRFDFWQRVDVFLKKYLNDPATQQ